MFDHIIHKRRIIESNDKPYKRIVEEALLPSSSKSLAVLAATDVLVGLRTEASNYLETTFSSDPSEVICKVLNLKSGSINILT